MILHKSQNNIYDNLIIVFLALQIFGVIGDAAQPIRLFVIACIPFMVNFFILSKESRGKNIYQIGFLLLWMVYALFTLMWAFDLSESLKHILYLMVNFSGFFVLLWLATKANRPQNSVVIGWIIVLVLSIPIALYELWFDVHLPVSTYESGSLMNFGFAIIERNFASVTYGNLNGYNTILCYILPFVLFNLLSKETRRVAMLINWVLLLILFYIIISNSSRGAIFVFVLALTIFFLYYFKNGRSVVVLVLVCLVAVYYVLQHFDTMFGFVLTRFATHGLEDVGRTENIKSGIETLVNTNFLGIGIGNYTEYMDKNYHLSILSPHNIFVEIWVEFGLLVLIGFLILLLKILRLGLHNPNIANREFIIISLAVFPLSNIIDSTYLLSMHVWVLLASYFVMADSYYEPIEANKYENENVEFINSLKNEDIGSM